MSDSPDTRQPSEELTSSPSAGDVALPGPGPSPGSPDVDLTPEEAEVVSEMSIFDLADTTEKPPTQSPPGDEKVLTGTIVQAHGDDVFIDVGGKAEGVVPRSQFGEGDEPSVGRRVEVVFDHFDTGSQIQVFSRQGAARVAMWETLAPGMLVEGRITGMNKGGLEIDLKGIRGFMPASHVDMDRMKDISVFIGQTVPCEVIKVDRRQNDVLLSRRRVQEKERAAAREALLVELAEGQTRKGVVRNLTDFGAFVDLGGVDGLVHISDMSWSQVDKPGDVVSLGQEIEVKVLKIDRERERISLGFKQVQPDPWHEVETKYPVGSQLKVRILRLADFGAFAEVEEGVEALIPLSEMSWERVGRPKRVVSQGQIVDVAVIRVEPRKRRMALSIKQATPDPWAGVEADFPKDATATGTVTKVVEFGAFVQLRPGVEGLIHVSELSDQRVRSPSDVVKPGQEVTVKVLDVDIGQRRIALSIKATLATESSGGPDKPETKTPAKKRKKPLRGGLSSKGSGGLLDGLLG